MATTRRVPPGTASAHTASSKSRASAPSMVTSCMLRRSRRFSAPASSSDTRGSTLAASSITAAGKESLKPRATTRASTSCDGSPGFPSDPITSPDSWASVPEGGARRTRTTSPSWASWVGGTRTTPGMAVSCGWTHALPPRTW
jgi:hypothetical protein